MESNLTQRNFSLRRKILPGTTGKAVSQVFMLSMPRITYVIMLQLQKEVRATSSWHNGITGMSATMTLKGQ
ncbi:hypothetical protein SDC9_177244 [bioreactor metagenome]|uniref:Uncharacterized protein n=1 Tax=bioreactor metagenome TaxID=1076179 RepID=A0A645GSG3_9ZZZZ